VASGDELRGLMRYWPHGVAVLTVQHDGARMGITVSSLVSLSFDPPLIGVALGVHSAAVELVRGAGGFGLSLLAAGQDAVAQHFARGVPPIAHWHGIETREGASDGATLVEGAIGWLECRSVAEHAVGDHVLFVGEVVSVERGTPGPALVYREGGYASS
jgi:flavin reductase (DIM6/NTAB) family NADH-FMN oxidoreductase RutF